MVAMKPRTKAKWSTHVAAWQASGESARAFAARHGLSASMLYARARELASSPAPRIVQVVPKSQGEGSLPAEVGSLFVEVGAARVRVTAGFDPAVLSQVVRALSGGAR